MEGMLQMAREQLAEQSSQRPLRVMLEAGDQAVHREGVAPGRLDLRKGWRPFQAGAAGKSMGRQGQGQGADGAAAAEPGQFGLAAGADGQVAAGGMAEQAARCVAKPGRPQPGEQWMHGPLRGTRFRRSASSSPPGRGRSGPGH
ncbi:hypothetical protein D3C72_1923760 [compost metagenome]